MAMTIEEQEPRIPARERAKNRERGKVERMEINGREAVNIHGANEILDERAKIELGEERHYYESRPYALYRAKQIEGVSVSRRVFYYVDSLYKVPLPKKYTAHGGGYRRDYALRYPEHIKARGLALLEEGKSQADTARAIATEFGLSRPPTQAVYYWARDKKEQEHQSGLKGRPKRSRKRPPVKRRRA